MVERFSHPVAVRVGLEVKCGIFGDFEKKRGHLVVAFKISALFRSPALSKACQ